MVAATGTPPACPKTMVFGPCGGVRADGGCEVADHRCTFLHDPVTAWSGPPPPEPVPHPMRDRLAAGRVVLADFPARALDAGSITAVADRLRGHVDAVLAGDSPRERVQFSPAYRARLIIDAGLQPWSGLNCRDRNRVALEGEVAGLAHAAVAAVHCVTGDHTASGRRPDAAPVFDLDSTRLASVARAAGLLVSVAESPACPPTAARPSRLLTKIAAGAEIVIIDHCGGVEPVAVFLSEVAELLAGRGSVPLALACVPVVVDAESAALLASFPGLVLPPGYLDRVLASPDPRRAGIDATVELAEQLLAVPGVAGVNLSGGGAPGAELAFADALAEIGSRIAGT